MFRIKAQEQGDVDVSDLTVQSEVECSKLNAKTDHHNMNEFSIIAVKEYVSDIITYSVNIITNENAVRTIKNTVSDPYWPVIKELKTVLRLRGKVQEHGDGVNLVVMSKIKRALHHKNTPAVGLRSKKRQSKIARTRCVDTLFLPKTKLSNTETGAGTSMMTQNPMQTAFIDDSTTFTIDPNYVKEYVPNIIAYRVNVVTYSSTAMENSDAKDRIDKATDNQESADNVPQTRFFRRLFRELRQRFRNTRRHETATVAEHTDNSANDASNASNGSVEENDEDDIIASDTIDPVSTTKLHRFLSVFLCYKH
ncbi:uncharacterized protein [Antedon mediterranea]|uniref:uncharacterized protein n=1 Tax=Antedon mediterranea TaxID=105859 RepID=UPI003AF546F5